MANFLKKYLAEYVLGSPFTFNKRFIVFSYTQINAIKQLVLIFDIVLSRLTLSLIFTLPLWRYTLSYIHDL